MSKRKKEIDWAQVSDDKDKLLAAGFKVIEKSPWHWHVKKENWHTIVNVWPTARKYMKDGSNGANHYKDVVKAVEGIYNNMAQVGGGQVEAQKEVEAMREGGLDYIKNKFKK